MPHLLVRIGNIRGNFLLKPEARTPPQTLSSLPCAWCRAGCPKGVNKPPALLPQSGTGGGGVIRGPD